MAPAEFDKAVSDLVGFMVWMAEPQQEFRRTARLLCSCLPGFALHSAAYALKKEYWKDIH
jgi:ubiquinol-cytochrome c reductase cytochrome c1 subunit